MIAAERGDITQVVRYQAIGTYQGDEMLFTDCADGGDMWTGTGPRERRKRVRFARAFKEVPVVPVGLSSWDMHGATYPRADVTYEDVTRDGFDIVFRASRGAVDGHRSGLPRG